MSGWNILNKSGENIFFFFLNFPDLRPDYPDTAISRFVAGFNCNIKSCRDLFIGDFSFKSQIENLLLFLSKFVNTLFDSNMKLVKIFIVTDVLLRTVIVIKSLFRQSFGQYRFFLLFKINK